MIDPAGGSHNPLARASVKDPTYPHANSRTLGALPKWLRVIWEKKQDLEEENKFLRLVCLLLLAFCFFLGLIIHKKITEPVQSIVDLPNFIIYPKVETFRLREDMLRNFLREVGSAVYQVSPGHYDISLVADRINPKVAQTFIEYYAPMSRVLPGQKEERIEWRLRELRAYDDPAAPGYLTLAGRCSRTRYTVENAVPSVKTEEIVQVYYLNQGRPTPTNPLGLTFAGVREFSEGEADRVWQVTQPITDHPAQNGEKIAPARIP